MYNMRDKILKTPFIIENAVKCMEELGIEPVIIPVRGGVDGAEITFKACPAPTCSQAVTTVIPSTSIRASSPWKSHTNCW